MKIPLWATFSLAVFVGTSFCSCSSSKTFLGKMNPFASTPADTRSILDNGPAASGIVANASSVELFLSRTEMTRSEFEQHKLREGVLFSECGEQKRGRLIPKGQRVTNLSDEAIAQINDAVKAVLKDGAEQDFALALPGTKASMFDPGKFLMTITGSESGGSSDSAAFRKLETSLDSISEPKDALSRKMKVLAEKIRLFAPSAALCGNEIFYGLGRK